MTGLEEETEEDISVVEIEEADGDPVQETKKALEEEDMEKEEEDEETDIEGNLSSASVREES